MSNIPTPQTEAALNDSVLENKSHPHTDWVPAFFARTLERRAIAAEAQVTAMRSALESIANMPEYDQDDAHRLRHHAKCALTNPATGEPT